MNFRSLSIVSALLLSSAWAAAQTKSFTLPLIPGLPPKLTNLVIVPKPVLPAGPKPGLYVTRPYSMLVLVPGDMDPKFVWPAAPLNPPMPIIRPGLEFIPYKSRP